MNDGEFFKVLEDLYQKSISGDLESFESYCTKYLHKLLRKVDSSVRGPVNVFRPFAEPPQTTREVIIVYSGRIVLIGRVSASEDLETSRDRLVSEVQRMVADRQQRSLSIWNIFALAASTVCGIKCEFAQVKPDGEMKILNGPLSFKRDQDAIENNLRDCLRIASEDACRLSQRAET